MRKNTLLVLMLSMSLSGKGQSLRGDISLSDPFVMANVNNNTYYMTGTGGKLWTSKDMETWTGPSSVIETSAESWMGASPSIWAPEIYYFDDTYYFVPTLTNQSVTIDASGHKRRAVHILSSKLPGGKYTLIEGGDATYVPADKCTLDGSIFTDTDGTRYLIYCHEWIQNNNGTIEYIKLKDDLSGTTGSGVVMTRAKNATWNTSTVTDGPFLFRTQTGRLGMIWTSWNGDRYVQGVAYSSNGKLNGTWTHESLPITPDNYGHGMLFRTFDGQLLMSIHSNRNIDLDAQRFERHPTFFVMDDRGDYLRTVMEYKKDVGLSNPAKVMVDNPEFNYGTNGWTNATTAQNRKIANNQSGAITGNYFESWDAGSFTGEIYQERIVPNGTYQVSAAAFRSYPISGGSGTASTVKLFANSEIVEVTTTNAKTYTVTVYVNDGKLRFGLRSEKKNFQWMGLDNVTVNYFGEENHTEEEIDYAERNSHIYFRNCGNGMYLNAGNSWGTQAVFSDHALDFRLVELSNGKYLLDSGFKNGVTDHYVSSNGYLDGSFTAFTIGDVNGNVYLSCASSNYWGNNGGTLSTQLKYRTNKNAQWEMLTFDDLMKTLNDASESNPVDATFLIQCPNFGRNDTRLGSWQGTYTQGGDVTNMCLEAPTTSFNISQTLDNIPNGLYELRVQGFYRYGSTSSSKAAHDNGTEKLDAYLYGNSRSMALRSIYDVTGSVPTTLENASSMFTNKQYANTLQVEVTDGQLTLGVKKATGNTPAENWTVFDNFELYYLGNQSTVIDDVQDSKPAVKGIYDLSGRKYTSTEGLSQGVYIVDGKVVLIQ